MRDPLIPLLAALGAGIPLSRLTTFTPREILIAIALLALLIAIALHQITPQQQDWVTQAAWDGRLRAHQIFMKAESDTRIRLKALGVTISVLSQADRPLTSWRRADRCTRPSPNSFTSPGRSASCTACREPVEDVGGRVVQSVAFDQAGNADAESSPAVTRGSSTAPASRRCPRPTFAVRALHRQCGRRCPRHGLPWRRMRRLARRRAVADAIPATVGAAQVSQVAGPAPAGGGHGRPWIEHHLKGKPGGRCATGSVNTSASPATTRSKTRRRR